MGPHKKREIKARNLSSVQLEEFVNHVIVPTPDLKLTVVGLDTRLTPKQRLAEWRDSISHYCLGASEFSKSRQLRPADRQYEEMSGWLWHRSPENLAHMMSLAETTIRAAQNAVIWFHDQKFESEFADLEVAIDRSFIRSLEHEVFWREFFRGYFLNRSRREPFKSPEHWVREGHVFERLCSKPDGQIDLAPIFRDRTYFVDSTASEGVQIADICSHVCLRHHRGEVRFNAYTGLRPFIVDVNKGPITLLIPTGHGGLEGQLGTKIQEEVAEHARKLDRRVRRK